MKLRILALVGALAILGAACTEGGDAAMTTVPSSSAGDYAYPTTTIAFGPATEDKSGDEFTGSNDGGTAAEPIPAVLTPADLGRSIVYTATIEVEVDDVVAAGAAAQAAIAPYGGLLFGQDTTTGPNARSVLTIKVRPEDFEAVLDALSGIGTLVSQSVDASDVTERVVDLQSRITTAEASVERLRTFLTQATDLKDVAEIESELLRRETDLELLRGQLRTIENAVSLATITVVFSEPTPEPVIELTGTAYFGHDGGQACPGSRDLAADEGDLVTYCYQVENTGDTDLADIEIRDTGLDARMEDFIVVEGDPAATLAPGDRILLALEIEAAPAVSTDPSVTATAVDADGTPIRETVGTTIDRADVSVTKDTSLPGFTDSLKSSWHGLQHVFGLAVVMLGALVPFLWIPVLLALIALWWRRRTRSAIPPSTPEA
jgi:hypothetical protein